eukprot:COSAG04_NODE_16923_length_485_cov_0.800518_1_plen_120_part_01
MDNGHDVESEHLRSVLQGPGKGRLNCSVYPCLESCCTESLSSSRDYQLSEAKQLDANRCGSVEPAQGSRAGPTSSGGSAGARRPGGSILRRVSPQAPPATSVRTGPQVPGAMVPPRHSGT